MTAVPEQDECQVSESPAMVGQTIDRAAHRRTDEEWLAEAWRRSRVVVIDGDRTLVGGDPLRLVLVDPELAPDGEPLFLGVDADETPYFAVAGPLPAVAGAEPSTLRTVGELLTPRDVDLFTAASGLAHWHERHAFNPADGEPTAIGDAGWVRRSQDGGALLFPRTDPAVIVLIHDGVPGETGRAMLARGASWPPERFSCLAGFVEPGESAESTVVREVFEEVGLTIRDVRYVASQPWPFPGSLMLAFTALADPEQPLRLEPAEIAEARWFTRPELRQLWSRRKPIRASVAYHLMSRWLYEA